MQELRHRLGYHRVGASTLGTGVTVTTGQGGNIFYLCDVVKRPAPPSLGSRNVCHLALSYSYAYRTGMSPVFLSSADASPMPRQLTKAALSTADILGSILDVVDGTTLTHAGAVCKTWRDTTYAEARWRSFACAERGQLANACGAA